MQRRNDANDEVLLDWTLVDGKSNRQDDAYNCGTFVMMVCEKLVEPCFTMQFGFCWLECPPWQSGLKFTKEPETCSVWR